MIPVKLFPSRGGRESVDKLFGDFFDVAPFGGDAYCCSSNLEEDVITPAIEFTEKKDEYIIRAELPGVKKEDIDLTIVGDELKLRAEIKGDDADEECRCSEIAHGKFFRTIPLPSSAIIADKVVATSRDGILEIRLPKKEEAVTKEAKIKVA